MKTRKVRIVIGDAVIASATNVFDLIEPLWEQVETCRSWAHYLTTLRPFSTSQRHLFAIQLYRVEVNNGGHDFFFWNPAGIVWEHALEGLEALGLTDVHAILKAASARLVRPSRDRVKRQSQVDTICAPFDGLDARFYAIDRTGELHERMLAFARQHPSDFRFSGIVKTLDLPRRRDLRLVE